MSDKKINKVLWWLSLPVMMLTLILANALQWIKPSDYDKLLSIIPYKWQLTIYLTIILSLIIALLYRKAFPVTSSEKNDQQLKSEVTNNTQESIPMPIKKGEMENDHDILMGDLSLSEKLKLQIFLKENRKVIFTQYDSDIKNLCYNRILRCDKYNPNSPSEIIIKEWAWKWINENKEKLS